MSRYTIVYPSDGSPSYYKGSDREDGTVASAAGPTIMPDLPDFVSSVDGKVYSGRAGMRDHCARHNVVPVEELRGLPFLTSTSDQRSSEQRRADAETRKRTIINEVDPIYRKHNHG